MAPSDFSSRPNGNIVILFDVDETLTKARRLVKPEMLQALKDLRQKYVIGFVGGSNLVKQKEQLGDNVLELFDYCFAENGLVAYKLGEELASQSFIKWLGEEKYAKMARFILRWLSERTDIPIVRGTFIEFRNGMINVSPIGRNASNEEKALIAALQKEFPDYGLTYAIGGQISFDVFPTGWDKTYCLRHLEKENFKEIHFFGDKTFNGGNDYEIYEDERTIGHAVLNPDDTLAQLKKDWL
ncbi:eukaryotic phosphomannomutase [Atractiella rhizophila]|nr:eukaryotic phosphomannomutase [Atractiella rhizophila]